MDTRTQLLDHAEAVARARGFDGFSYADLAEAVGIRKPSIHHHFPKKADLAQALIDRYSAVFFQRLDAIAAQEKTASGRLHRVVLAYRDGLEDGRKLCLCVALAVGRDSLSEPVIASLADFHERVTRWLEECFAQGVADGSVAGVSDPAAEASAALALMEGAQLIARSAMRVDLFDAATTSFLGRLR